MAQKARYPKVRVNQWIDTSEEAMNKPSATILFGVDIKPSKDRPWMKLVKPSPQGGYEPLLYATIEEASAKCGAVRKQYGASPTA